MQKKCEKDTKKYLPTTSTSLFYVILASGQFFRDHATASHSKPSDWQNWESNLSVKLIEHIMKATVKRTSGTRMSPLCNAVPT